MLQVSTMSMVWEVFANDVFHIRSYGKRVSDALQDRLSQYSRTHYVGTWTIGETVTL